MEPKCHRGLGVCVTENGTTALLSLGTNDEGGPITFPQLVDIDGDGATDIVDVKQGTETATDGSPIVTPHYTAYNFRDGHFTKDGTAELHAVFDFSRHEGKPSRARLPFMVPSAGQYRVVGVNGSAKGDRCTAGIIWINDAIAFGDADFKQHTGRMQTTVSVGQANTLEVELRSGPECKIVVMIGSAP